MVLWKPSAPYDDEHALLQRLRMGRLNVSPSSCSLAEAKQFEDQQSGGNSKVPSFIDVPSGSPESGRDDIAAQLGMRINML